MNKRQFLQLIDKYYFNYDLREIRVTIWTGYSSSCNYLDSWLTVDCYNENRRRKRKGISSLVYNAAHK